VAVGAVAVGAAVVAGAALGPRTAVGLGLVAAVCCTPLVLGNPALGIVVWVPLVFLSQLPQFGRFASIVLILTALAWLAGLQTRRVGLAPFLRGHRFLVPALACLVTWLALSLVWARYPGLVGGDLRKWCEGAALLVVVATTIRAPHQLRLVLAAFVFGALLSVALGWTGAALPLTPPSHDPSGHLINRFQGAEGNPNGLAAVLVPAIVLSGALVADSRRLLVRWTLLAITAALVVALAATASRGGVLAAAAVAVAALFIYRRQRLYILVALALVAAVGGAWFAVSPNARDRIVNYSDDGAGRGSLWKVAWWITEDEPVTGVGLNNFRSIAPAYARDPGPLRFAEQITERPHVVHNIYLQLLAETGVLGLALFLAVVAACLDAARRAVRSFERLGHVDLARLARASMLAICALLAAAFFQSLATDGRLWLLLALGPALLAMTRRVGDVSG
jgi:O-antigen ligase